MSDINRRRMIQLSGGIALASMAGCLGSDDDPDDDSDDTSGDNDENGNDTSGDDHDDEKKTGEKDDKPKSGDDAPKVDVETPDGKTITIEAKDKPTVVMFADITSAKGKSYSKTLVDLHEKYGDRAYVLTVSSNMDVSKADVKEFHGKYGGDWDHAMCDLDALDEYGIEASVTIYVIDEHGKIAFRANEDVDRKAVEAALEAYVDGDIDEETIEKALEAYRDGDVDEETIEEAIKAYRDGDVDEETIEEAIKAYSED